MPDPSSIRFPEPLRERLAESAAAERRTFSAEVLVLVESALAARQRAQVRAEAALIDELDRQFTAEPR